MQKKRDKKMQQRAKGGTRDGEGYDTKRYDHRAKKGTSMDKEIRLSKRND